MAPTDEEFINLYIAGDDKAFKALLEKYTPHIYNFVRRLCGAESAPDVTQDTFIKVWKNIKKFDASKASFKTWLFHIARNTATDFLRKKKSIVFSDLSVDEENNLFEDTIPDEAILPDQAVQKLQDTEFLNTLLSKLSLVYQSVLVLHYQEEMTFAEIAEVIGAPLNTVKSHHRRALLQLRKMVG